MSKKTSIAIISVLAVLIILGAIFGTMSLDKGELGTVDYTAFSKKIKLGLDLKGGVYAVYSAEQPEDMNNDTFKANLEGTAKSLEDLLFSKGYSEALVSVSVESKQIRVEVPDVEDPETIFDLIGRPASLEFKETSKEGTPVSGKVLINGDDVKLASVGMQEGKYVVQLEFTSKGTKKFAQVTSDLKDKYLGIFINDEFYMAPQVNDTISNGKAIISNPNGYEYDEAYEIAVRIQSGTFKVPLVLEESDTISPTLGKSALTTGIIAGILGLLFIVVFMTIRYKLLGLCASLALLFFTVNYLFVLAIFPWVQLTLPGIAGILLSIGMAVDANVIVFERIRENAKNGKSIQESVKLGFRSSVSAIVDGNITTIIGAIVLFIFGVASIKGFAITLLIGIVLSLITAMVITRLIIKCFCAIFGTENRKLFGLEIATEAEQEQEIEESTGGNE